MTRISGLLVNENIICFCHTYHHPLTVVWKGFVLPPALCRQSLCILVCASVDKSCYLIEDVPLGAHTL